MRRLLNVCVFLILLAVLPCAAEAITADEGAVSVRTLTLTHTGNLSVEDEKSVIQEVKSHKYKSTDLDEVGERVRFALQRHGFFKVLVNDPVFRVITREQDREIVDVTVAVEEGQIYMLGSMKFSDATVFTPEELRRQFRIADGDIFDREKIAEGLEGLRHLYATKGYVNFSAVPQQEIDETAHTVSLLIDLDSGAAFRLGRLTVQGEESEPGAREKLLNAWKRYEGRTYDYRLLSAFLRDMHARPSVKPEQVFAISQDLQARIINVQITLIKPYTLEVSQKSLSHRTTDGAGCFKSEQTTGRR